MARPKFYFYCYPWDLEDEGLEESLGRLAGEIGVDGITVAATETDIRMIRGRPIGERRTFICPAGAHFQPDSAIHRGNRIRPIPASWMKSKNPLERIAKVAAKERLSLRVRVNICDGVGIVERNSHAACTNVLGDTSTHRLCPSHPDVRQYTIALVEDLFKNYPVEVVEISDWGLLGRRTSRDAYQQYGIAQHDSYFLRWCFCSSCRQRAIDSGVNVEAVRAEISTLLDDEIQNGRQEPDNSPSHGHETPSLAAYRHVLSDSGLQLLQLASASRVEDVRGWSGPVIRGKSHGFSPNLIRQTPDGLVADVTEFSLGDRGICIAAKRGAEDTNLVAEVQRDLKDNVGAIVFENYGECPESRLDWVRQAIRYAKRESSS